MFSLRKDLPVLTDCGYFSGGALERDMGFFKFFKVFFNAVPQKPPMQLFFGLSMAKTYSPFLPDSVLHDNTQ